MNTLVPDVIICNTFSNVNHLEQLVKYSLQCKRIRITAPYITMQGIGWLLDAMKAGTSVSIVTEISGRALLSKSLDIDALEALLEAGADIRRYTENLHAKIYYFDQERVIVSSANLTSGGLTKNFEMGVTLSKSIVNSQTVKDHTNLFNQVDSIWNFVWSNSISLTKEELSELRSKLNAASEVLAKMDDLARSLSVELDAMPYSSLDRVCSNPVNIGTELAMMNMFRGFEKSMWDVFDPKEPLSPEYLDRYRENIAEKIEPHLGMFFKQFAHKTAAGQKLKQYDFGFSKSRLVKTFFPSSKYMFITKPRRGKARTTHIGEPAFIVNMQLDRESGKKYLEARFGIEEDILDSITEMGISFIQKILNSKDKISEILRGFGEGWLLTHGSYSRGLRVEIPLADITAQRLQSELSRYVNLPGALPADICIRRQYFWDHASDSLILSSEKISEKVSGDFMRLMYFFDLAHQAMYHDNTGA